MNPIDEYAAHRPDHVAPTFEELDQLWDQANVPERAPLRVQPSPEVAKAGRRRVALLGAAASLIVGVAAIALVADRAQAPTGVAETDTVPASGAPTSTDSSASLSSDESEPTEPVAAPSIWAVAESGWVSSAPVVRAGVAAVTLVAGPEGVSQSWVAVVDGMSEPLVRVGVLPTDFPQRPNAPDVDEVLVPEPATSLNDPSESDDPIVAIRIDPASGNYLVSAGGVARSDAQAVFTAVRSGADMPPGFTVLPESSGELAQHRVTQRFDHPDGRWIEIETQSGGQPRYIVELQQATAIEPFETPDGVDVSNIAFSEESTLLLRAGFWVSTVRTSASGDAADFNELIELIELDGDVIIATDSDSDSTDLTVAVGDSVMLGAAAQLSELGLTVDAVESRAFAGGLDLVRTLVEQDRRPETLIVHLGSNGSIGEADMVEFVRLVAGLERVVLVTSAMDRDYNDPNNELIADFVATQDNLELLDWSGLAERCPGDCFEADGFHLTPDGREYYAALVAAVLDDGGA